MGGAPRLFIRVGKNQTGHLFHLLLELQDIHSHVSKVQIREEIQQGKYMIQKKVGIIKKIQ